MARQHRTTEVPRSGNASPTAGRYADPNLPPPAESERHNTTNTKEKAVRHTVRPYATVGVAMVGAGLFAATPVATPLPDINTFRAVVLTADEDLAAPWLDQFNTASQNATQLLNNMFAPAVSLQQELSNLSGYAQEFLNDPSSINTVMAQLQTDLNAWLAAPTLQGQVGPPSNADSMLQVVTRYTLNGDPTSIAGGHHDMLWQIAAYLPASINPDEAQSILNFLGSPVSGLIMGALGPAISPWVALGNSLSAGDDWNTTLANMVGAYFNGATLSLNGLLPLIQQANVLPTGMSIVNLDIAFGGLLTAGDVKAFSQVGAYTIPSAGGSIFNSLGVAMSGVPSIGNLNLVATPVGPIGAMEGFDQAIAAALGWTGQGAPVTGIDLPTTPVDLSDSGSAVGTAAADLSTLVNDFLALF